ncbi:LLM class flavin-dependent oxidoreductase [Synechococcus sp. FACHB-909]|uniref:LLM class flavin-dependent oxidoreductase n=1 Tax=Synechococcus sp. FACHB-909 TaxID=2692863 RepID=UPI001685828E|nr:LLM class flavin-dependent oxidoreductase [Synechococcus sp. FACHB-909]MBD2719327.1 LLM class flavin-dependent oxidoreductase [Synechococcus sp. FACHB-909]
MKFYSFHLMPYGALDLDYVEKHISASLVLPNTYYDPQIGHQLYNRYLDELELADELGFDGVCVNEHHQSAYGLMPTPAVMAGALSRSVKRGKICILGRALPLLSNPLSVAEEYAMLDNITGGRFIAGFVRGIGVEYHATGVNPTYSLERFHEAHDLIIRAWTEEGPFPFEGKHYSYNYVNLWPRPFQQPHPDVWIPSGGSLETIRWASDPKRKYVYLNVYSNVDVACGLMDTYRNCAEEYGYTASSDQLGMALPIYVAETDAIARREAKPHIEAFFNKFLRMTNEMLLPPGYTSVSSLKTLLITSRETLMANHSLEAVDKLGMFLVGSPETVRQRLAEFEQRLGIGHLCAIMQFGSLPHAQTKRNLELFAEEVMPHFRAKVTAGSCP